MARVEVVEVVRLEMTGLEDETETEMARVEVVEVVRLEMTGLEAKVVLKALLAIENDGNLGGLAEGVWQALSDAGVEAPDNDTKNEDLLRFAPDGTLEVVR